VPPFRDGDGHGLLRILAIVVLYRLALLVLDCCRLGSVSHLVVGGVVDERRDFKRAVVPLVEVVLLGFVDHGGREAYAATVSQQSQRLACHGVPVFGGVPGV
jgi:hypothetical protein